MVAKEIPLLTEADIDCRVQSVKETKKSGKVGAVLLLYKDARVDMRVLDEVYGPGNWQRTHEVIAGNLFCNIDLWDEEKKCWVRKQDVGTESNTEKEKGQASDSFKRAGFNVGIGRELYSAPFIYVPLEDDEYYGSPPRLSSSLKFSVAKIGYNERREINALEIVDNHGNSRFRMSDVVKHGTPKERPKAKSLTPLPNAGARYKCEKCGQFLQPYTGKDGKTVDIKHHVEGAYAKFGKILCIDCIMKGEK